MATQSRRKNSPLAVAIQHQANTFNLDQLIRLLVLRSDSNLSGIELCDHIDKVFLLRSDVSYAAPEYDVVDLSYDKNQNLNRLVVSHFGILGFNSSFPAPYKEWIFRDLNDGYRLRKHSAMLDFIDIFNHRFIAIRHQNRAMQRLSLHSGKLRHAPITKMIESVAGFYHNASYDLIQSKKSNTENQFDVEKQLILSFAGLFFNPRKSSSFIANLIQSVFNIPAIIEQFRGSWQSISRSDQNQFGLENCTLGKTLILGNRFWDQQSKIRITLGPMNFHQAVDLHKNGLLHLVLCKLIHFISTNEWDTEVRLTVPYTELAHSTLHGTHIGKTNGLRLGRTSWLKSRTYSDRADFGKLGITTILRHVKNSICSTTFTLGIDNGTV